jgi:tetratricopeptide (TPR) repeat protein
VRAGLSMDAVSMLERGVRQAPRRSTITLLARALGLEPDQRRSLIEAASRRQTAGRFDGIEPALTFDSAAHDPIGHHYPAPAPLDLVPAQLPAPSANLVARHDALRSVRSVFERAHDQTGVASVPMVAIHGPPGIGKTALALHAAHGVRPLFPDGQLFVDLRGPEPRPLEAHAVLGTFLRSLGTAPAAIPESLDERVWLYRARLAGRRILVFLDNAQSERQVMPLIPGSSTSGVLVTSRRRLPLLDVTRSIALDTLPPESCIELLTALVGGDRVGNEPDEARRIGALCGGLPLALRISGAKLAVRSHWTLRHLADKLSDEHRRLQELRMGDQEVRAGFALSYGTLAPVDRAAFRLLGLLDGEDFEAWAAAALLDRGIDEAEECLDRLADAQCLTPMPAAEGGGHRYRLHDLMRLFARERLADETPEAEGRAALERYLCTTFALAARADRLLSTGNSQVTLDAGRSLLVGDEIEHSILIADPLRWFDVERRNLLIAVRQAFDAGLWHWAYHIATALFQFFERLSLWDDWLAALRHALDASRRMGDRGAEASSLRLLGRRAERRRETEQATRLFTEALGIFRQLGDPRGQYATHRDLSIIDRICNRHQPAVERLRLALDGARNVNDRFWEAFILRELSIEHRFLQQWDRALECGVGSAELFGHIGEPHQQACTWFELGILERHRQRWTLSTDYHGRAVQVFAQRADRKSEAHALRDVGIGLRQQGRPDEALVNFEKCLRTFAELRDRWEWAGTLQEVAMTTGLRGDHDAARGAAEQAGAMFAELGDTQLESRVHVLLGAIELKMGRREVARSHLSRSLQVLQERADHVWRELAVRGMSGGSDIFAEIALGAVERAGG